MKIMAYVFFISVYPYGAGLVLPPVARVVPEAECGLSVPH